MEKEKLEVIIIRHSITCFESPILIIKKKEESYRLFVNYKQFNLLTIKDKFSISLLKELLDELDRANRLDRKVSPNLLI